MKMLFFFSRGLVIKGFICGIGRFNFKTGKIYRILSEQGAFLYNTLG